MNDELFSEREYWTPEAIAAWLAGLTDSAGRLQVRSRSVVLIIEGRDTRALRAIARVTGCGHVDELPRRRPPIWRITKPEELRHVLRITEPYLITSRGLVNKALTALEKLGDRKQARDQRDREILALWLGGKSKNSLALAFGLPPFEITRVIERYKRGPTTSEMSPG